MRFYLTIAVIVAIAIIILLWMRDESGQPAKTANLAPAQPVVAAPQNIAGWQPPATAVATPPPTPAPVVAVVTQANAYAAVPASPPPAQPVIMTDAGIQHDPCSRMATIAQKTRCTVVGCNRQAAWALVTLKARDRNFLGDFLDEAIREGAKFDDSDRMKTFREFIEQGYQMYSVTYKLAFP